ncbi:MAG: hypothetical protein JXA14_16565 [Anaerolineae bacterium]|nr:hypothetical protein [Anaerolineae bacterium]
MKKSGSFALLVVVLLVLASFACVSTPVPPTAVEVFVPTSIPPTPSNTPKPPPPDVTTEPPTKVPTLPPPTKPPVATQTPPPTEPPPEPTTEELAILSFTVAVGDIEGGKKLTFSWQTTGAVRATIVSGTSQRFPQRWEVGPNGTYEVGPESTGYRNPQMTLSAYDSLGNAVSNTIWAEWPCEYAYFFEPAPAACPLYEPSATWAAEQPFENGRMAWLEEVRGETFVTQRQILVFYNDGKYEQYQDAWMEGQPESDPSIVPPSGLYQPIRGFGKVWRENTSVRDNLGWATVPEQGFDSFWQQRFQESLPSVAYVRIFDGRVIEIAGWGWATGGTWEFVSP